MEEKVSEFRESDMGLSGTVVASWSVTPAMAGSNSFTVMTNIFVTEFISEKLKWRSRF